MKCTNTGTAGNNPKTVETSSSTSLSQACTPKIRTVEIEACLPTISTTLDAVLQVKARLRSPSSTITQTIAESTGSTKTALSKKGQELRPTVQELTPLRGTMFGSSKGMTMFPSEYARPWRQMARRMPKRQHALPPIRDSHRGRLLTSPSISSEKLWLNLQWSWECLLMFWSPTARKVIESSSVVNSKPKLLKNRNQELLVCTGSMTKKWSHLWKISSELPEAIALSKGTPYTNHVTKKLRHGMLRQVLVQM